MFARLADLLVRHPVAVLIGEAVLTLAAAWLATRIQFDFAPQSMLSGGNELRQELEDFKRTFAFEDSVLIVVLEATGEDDVLTADALTWQLALTREVESLPAVERVESVANLQTVRRGLGFPPKIEAVPALPEYPVDEGLAGRMRRIVAKSPLLEGSLLSGNERITALMCFLAPELQSLDEVRAAIDDVQDALARHPVPAGYHVRLTGLPYLRADTVDNLQADQQRLLPIAGVLYLIMLGVVFRRVSGSLLPLLAVGMGLAWTVGGLVLTGETFNLISNILPVLLLVIGVSNCVHIVADYGETTPRVSGDRREAMRRVTQHMGYACLLSMLTTAVGFASLFNARSAALVSFGWQCAFGMACLYVTIICTLGSGLQFFRPPRAVVKGAPLSQLVMRAAHIVNRHPKSTLLVAVLVLAGMLWSARAVRVNASMIETYEPGHPTLESLQLVERELGGLLPLEVNLQAAAAERFLEPDVYRRVEEFERIARRQADVLFARSYVDLHDAIGQGLTGSPDNDDDAADAEDNESLERRLSRSQWLLEHVGDSLSYGSFMTADGRRARILIKARDVGTRKLHQLIRLLDGELQRLFPGDSGIDASLTGDAYVNTLAMENVVRDLFTSLLTATVVIFSIIGIGFRSLRTGLISFVPNMTPLLFTLGYMGLRGYDLNVSNVIVFTISLGIAVDDTIHFLSRFRESLKLHHDVHQAVSHAFAETGRAIVIVTILIVSGLSVLLFSDFLPTRRFAELTIVTMTAAIFGDLLLLPACLLLFWKRKQSTIDVGTPENSAIGGGRHPDGR